MRRTSRQSKDEHLPSKATKVRVREKYHVVNIDDIVSLCDTFDNYHVVEFITFLLKAVATVA